jgi:hypothetical protein
MTPAFPTTKLPLLTTKLRRLAPVSALLLAVTVFAQNPTPTPAPTPAPGGEQLTSARVIYEGKIRGTQVTVRAGPSENHYAITRLEDGAAVVITGIQLNWIRIAPPEGTFSLVARQFVEVTGNRGRIRGENVNVRAGSLLNTQYSQVQTKLLRGDVVEVLGEVETRDGVFLKIKPPPGAYYFVHREFVVPVRELAQAPVEPRRQANVPPEGGLTAGGDVTSATRPSATRPAQPPHGNAFGDGVAGDPRFLQGTIPGGQGTPANTPARDAAEIEFADAQRDWQAAMGLPLEQQALPELLARFERLATDQNLPVTLREQAKSSAEFIKGRNQTREELLAMRAKQAELQQRMAPLQDQNRDLQQRFSQMEMSRFTAVGQLRTSELVQGGHDLMRLVDPKTGHTLVYLRTNQAAYVGGFVGVKGEIAKDSVLGIALIVPTAISPLEGSMVGRGITAEIFPPSMRDQFTPPTPTPPANTPPFPTPGQP